MNSDSLVVELKYYLKLSSKNETNKNTNKIKYWSGLLTFRVSYNLHEGEIANIN